VTDLSENAKWALYYASLGWHVFPVHNAHDDGSCSCGNADCKAVGKHPRIREWEQTASTDPHTIESWWSRWPEASIGWAPGRSGHVVVDCDVKEVKGKDGKPFILDGEESLSIECGRLGIELPQTLWQRTGGGGKQFILGLPTGVKVQSRNAHLPGVDVKSSGGLVVLPYSKHRSGRRYEWPDGHYQTPVALCSEEVLGLLSRRGKDGDTEGKSPITGIDTWALLEGIEEGKRDDALVGLGIRHLKRGDHPAAVRALLREAAVSSGLDQQYADWKFEQAVKWVSENPPDALPDWLPDRAAAQAEIDAEIERKILDRLQTLRVNEEAKARLRREYSSRRGPVVVAHASELLAMPDPSWRVPNLLPEVGTFQMYGDSGVGKSFVGIDALLSIAAGVEWLGHFPVLGTGPVLYVAAEGGYDLGQRLRGWAQQRFGGRLPDGFFAMVEQSIDLRSADDTREVLAAAHERSVVAVLFDTWALHMPGGDENSSRDTGLVADVLKRFAVELRAVVGTIHHTGKNAERGARGSSAGRAAWDVEFSFDGNLLKQTKNRYGPKHQPIGVEMVEVAGTLVPQRIEAYTAINNGGMAVEDRIVEVVGLNPGANVTDVVSLLVTQDGQSVRKKTVTDTVAALIESGRLIDKGTGKQRAPKVLYAVDDGEGDAQGDEGVFREEPS
jgi:hypothetical protein